MLKLLKVSLIIDHKATKQTTGTYICNKILLQK